MRLNKKGSFVKGTTTYILRDSCKICGEPYLTQKKIISEFCSHACVDKDPEYRALKSTLQLGKKSSFVGRKHSDESKNKISLALKGNHNFSGWHHTDAAKLKMSKAKEGYIPCCSGMKHSIATRIKMSKNHADYTLDKHPNWRGGLSFGKYCFEWTRNLKKFIKERDGYKCLNPVCFKNSKKLDVHHIDYNKKNCNPDNLITLCTSCNAKANYDRPWYKEWYSLIIKKRYGGSFNGTYADISV